MNYRFFKQDVLQRWERPVPRESEVAELREHLGACFGTMVVICTTRGSGCCRSPRSIRTRRFVVTPRAACRCGRAHVEVRRGYETVQKALTSAPPEPRKKMVPRATRLDPFKPVIDGILTADLTALRKQRHTSKRIYDRLLEEHQAVDIYYQMVRGSRFGQSIHQPHRRRRLPRWLAAWLEDCGSPDSVMAMSRSAPVGARPEGSPQPAP